MVAEAKDYYQLLGISRKASSEEVRKAFRKLARQFHPDLAADKAMAEERFKEINAAYEVLGDPENRRRYDLREWRWHRFSSFGSRHVRPQSEGGRRRDWNGGFRPYTERPEFRSFYEEFFGGQGGRGNGFSSAGESDPSHESDWSDHRKAHAQRGEDLEGQILISLSEVLLGSIHTVSVLRNNPLTGEPERHSLHVRIPRGVQDGRVLRLVGRGDYGIAGGPAGDLFLRVRIANRADLRVIGTHLVHDLELTPWEALFGARKSIPTLEGTVVVRVPAGSLSGQRLRLRGKGLPDEDGIRGDLYAVISVKVRLKRMARRIFRGRS